MEYNVTPGEIQGAAPLHGEKFFSMLAAARTMLTHQVPGDMHTSLQPDEGTMITSAAEQRGVRIVLALLLVATVVALYGPLVRFPFVQDDWRVIHRFVFGRAPSVIAEILSPAGKFFYRPLAGIYFYGVYRVFGLNAAGFHILSLIVLAGSSLLVAALGRALTGDRVVAWGSAFLFAAAANVQFEPQMWMVGSFDTGAVLFSLLSLLALLRGRFGLSALAMGGALACKESAALLAVVAAAWMFIRGDVRRIAGKLKWHAALFALFLAVKLAGVSLFALPATDPYAARLTGAHILAHGELYGTWAIQAVTPLKNVLFTEGESRAVVLLALGAIALAALGAPLFSARRGFRGGSSTRAGLCAAAWMFLMIVPPLTLRGHVVTYYLAPALPGLAIGTMLALATAARVVSRGRRSALVFCALLAAACTVDGLIMVQKRMALGLADGAHATSRDGDDHLIRKGTVVAQTRAALGAILPSMPSHTLLVMEGVETGCFGGRYGLQVWYGDSTLMLAETPALPEGGGRVRATLAPEASSEPITVSVPADSVICVRAEGGRMVLVRDIPGAPSPAGPTGAPSAPSVRKGE